MMHAGLGSLLKSVLNGKKGFSGKEEGFKTENFTRHINEGGIKIVGDYEKKYSDLQVVGPMEKNSNQLAAALPEQLQAKFVACNLVSTEALAITNFSPILRSYQILGVNVGYAHRNVQGLKIFCAIMANCLGLAQVDRYKNGDTFTVSLDTFTDAAGRPQKAMSPRTMDDNGKLWIGILTLKN